MELTKEFIEANKLSEDQVKAVTEFGKTTLETEKGKIEKEWEGKAHENAQGIIAGAAASVEKETGIKRKDGEKIADYYKRAGVEFVSGKQTELDKAKADYEEKIKGVKDAGTLKDEYEKLKASNDEILKKYADYDTLKEKAEKADEYGQQLSGLKLDVAFTNSKPAFPDTVNQYEAKAKWDEFKANVLKTNTIELVDGVAVAVDKENPHKTTKLSDLVAKDEAVQALLKGRQQQGLGGKQDEKKTIEGVPFEVPAKGGTKEQAEATRNYLTKKGLTIASDEYASEFEKYMKLIKQQTAA
jgi:hypothetical protein